jgi:hypothetical protein
MNSWSNVIRGRAIRNGKLLEYKLETLAVQDSIIDSLFNYSIHPVSLTVKESFLPKDYSQQKVASSSISSQIDEEIRKDIRARTSR